MSTTSSLEGNYSPPSPTDLHFGDTTSSIFPDRPIRPLPKRRLRSRLSPGVAESILFPPNAKSSTVSRQSAGKDSKTYSNEAGDTGARYASQHNTTQANESYQFRGSEIGDQTVNGVRQKAAPIGVSSGRGAYLASRYDDLRTYRQAHMLPPIPPSAASSVDSIDGYDSFENTNNKKKRKIPISGSLSNHHSSLSADMAHMDISSTRNVDVSQVEPDEGVGQYYGSGSSAIAASSHGLGSSKGRLGRSGLRRPSGRSPLGVSFNGSNATVANRSTFNGGNREEVPGSESSVKSKGAVAQPSDQGIISAAIANAAALSSTPVRGQEEVSLLEQQSFQKPSSSKTQFTFVCESDSAKSMAWPGYGYPPSSGVHSETPSVRGGGQAIAKAVKGFSTQGTQTSPSMDDQTGQSPLPNNVNQQAGQQPRKPRRTLAKQLALAARDRRMAQDYENYNNPPKRDKFWVCDFCEYEMIFGEPPAALIRRYEIKDRSEQRRLAEKRRLLEKAKMKSRKGKKGTKNSKNQNAAQTQQQQNQNQKARYDAQGHEQGTLQSQDTQSEEQILDDYDDDDPYDPLPQDHRQVQQAASKTSQLMAQGKTQPLRPPAGETTGVGGGNAGRAA